MGRGWGQGLQAEEKEPFNRQNCPTSGSSWEEEEAEPLCVGRDAYSRKEAEPCPPAPFAPSSWLHGSSGCRPAQGRAGSQSYFHVSLDLGGSCLFSHLSVLQPMNATA